jgi:predicted RNA-binding protein with PUA-like domain
LGPCQKEIEPKTGAYKYDDKPGKKRDFPSQDGHLVYCNDKSRKIKAEGPALQSLVFFYAIVKNMAYWLMKSEPSAYSIADLKRDGKTGWGGVRNYSARNFLKAMKKGDQAFFYHSSVDPSAIVGVMEIVKEATPDPTQFDSKDGHFDPDSPPNAPRWFQVEVKFAEIFKRPVTLGEIRKQPALKNMVLLKRGRLSVQPVTPAEWDCIRKVAVILA